MKSAIEQAQDQLMIEAIETELYDNYDRGFMLRSYLNIAPNDKEAENKLNELIDEKNRLESELTMITK